MLMAGLLMAGFASAFTLDFYVYNYNTLQPIENANITVYNSSYEFSTITDNQGFGTLSSSTADYQYRVWRSGYAEYDSFLNVTNDTEKEIYLIPQSNSGIIRLRVVDMTVLGGHEYCLYFSSNNRLQGCYSLNDTLTIHNNMGYIWIPILQKTDLLGSPTGFGKYFWLYLENVLGYGVVFAIILAVIFSIWRFIVKRK